MTKKGFSLLFVLFFILSFSGTTFAASESNQWALRPTDIGDWGQATAYLGSGVTSLYVTVNQSGIHSGQNAYTVWKIYHPNTDTYEGNRVLNTDFYGTMIFSNLNHPGGNYDVIWESKTNNDTQGWYQLHTPTSSFSTFYRVR